MQQITGHEQNIAALKKVLESNKVAHAYLFVGPAGVGKRTVALAFARLLLCENIINGGSCFNCRSCRQISGGNHPDLHLVELAGATIKLEQIQQLQKQGYYRSYQGGRRIYLIPQSEVMTTPAANALLKILEEPPAEMVFILTSSRPAALLPTIRSRCQQFWFRLLTIDQITAGLSASTSTELTKEHQHLLAVMSGGSLGRALALVNQDIQAGRTKVIAILEKATANDLVALLMEAAALATDRVLIEELLEFLPLWLRDVLVWKITKNKSLISNIDMLPEITKQARQYPVSSLVAMLEETELMRKHLETKGNVRLLLDVFFLKLADLSQHSKQ